MGRLFLVVFFSCLFFSCNNNAITSEIVSLPGYWDQDKKVAFTIPALDSLQQYNVFLHLRNTNDYPYNNIYIIAEMVFPHGRVVKDTLEYRMAAADGTWLGNGIGNVKDSKLWYKEKISFFEAGKYTLILSQAVRNNGDVNGVSQLQGLTEIGYSVEAIKQ